MPLLYSVHISYCVHIIVYTIVYAIVYRPTLMSEVYNLHWLPIAYRVQYKVLLYRFTRLYPGCCSSIPSGSLIHMRSIRPGLRSADGLMLDVPRSRSATYGDRTFCVVGPRMWNDLPPELRNAQTVNSFKTNLKKLICQHCLFMNTVCMENKV